MADYRSICFQVRKALRYVGECMSVLHMLRYAQERGRSVLHLEIVVQRSGNYCCVWEALGTVHPDSGVQQWGTRVHNLLKALSRSAQFSKSQLIVQGSSVVAKLLGDAVISQ
jgi:hypothetical protein